MPISKLGIEFVVGATDKFSRTFNKVGKAMKTVGIAAGVATAAIGAAGVAIGIMAKHTAEAVDQVGKFAERLGISVEAMSEYSFVAERSGIAVSQLQLGFQRMTRRIAEAAQGIGEAKGALRELGLDAKKLSTMTADAQFEEVTKAMEGVTSESDKVRLAFKLFDSEGVALKNTMAEGAEGLRAMREEARRLGGSFSGELAEKSADFNDSMVSLKTAIFGAKASISEVLLPTLTNLSNKIADIVAANRGNLRVFTSNWLISLQNILISMVDWTGKVIKLFGKLPVAWAFIKLKLLELERAVVSSVQAIKKTIEEIKNLIPEEAVKGFTEFVDDWATGWGAIKKVVKPVVDIVADNWSTGMKKITEDTDGTFSELNNRIKEAQESFDGMSETNRSFNASVDSSIAKLKELIGEVIVLSDESDAALEKTAEKTVATMEKTQSAFDAFKADFRETIDLWATDFPTIGAQVGGLLISTFDMVAAGIGNAIAESIISGKDLMSSLKSLMKDVAKSVIAMLIKIAVQRLILSAVSHALNAKALAAESGAGVAKVFVNSFASAAAIPVVGWAIAPQVATANAGLALAGLTPAFGAGSAVGLALGGGQAHAGLTDVPREGTFLLDKGERVISARQNEDLTTFLEEGGGGGEGIINNFNILPNATNVRSMLDMTQDDWVDIAEQQIIPAMRRLKRGGVTV